MPSLNVVLVGAGLIGKELMKQLDKNRDRVAEQLHIAINVVAVLNSRTMILSDTHISSKQWREEVGSQDANIDTAVEHARTHLNPNEGSLVLIDCTSNESVAEKYVGLLASGVHVVTPNKKAGSGPLERYDAIQKRNKGAHFLAETTVGAGLPVIHTLHELVKTGHAIQSIEGVFSGTLSFLFNTFESSDEPWSAIVAKARELGYTEPDPRDDLNGMDVARKVTILARECGVRATLATVNVESLVPEELSKLESVEEFMTQLKEFDASMEELKQKAAAENQVLRYVGAMDKDGCCTVAIRRVDKSHPLAGLRGADNMVAFVTDQYTQPLVIQGAGAGAAVTASGVFADVLRLGAYLGGLA